MIDFKSIENETICNEYSNGVNNDGTIIAIDTLSITYDESRDDHNIYNVPFGANMQFYQDDTHDPYFSNGQNKAYVQTELGSSNSNSNNIFEIKLVGILICTVDVTDDDTISCCATNNDADTSLVYNITNDNSGIDTIKQFSIAFPVLFFIDATVELELNSNSCSTRRRRYLLSSLNQHDRDCLCFCSQFFTGELGRKGNKRRKTNRYRI